MNLITGSHILLDKVQEDETGAKVSYGLTCII